MERHTDQVFRNKVDCIVLGAQNDPVLKEGLKYIDEQAQHRGITFYEMMFFVVYMDVQKTSVREWFNNTQTSNSHLN